MGGGSAEEEEAEEMGMGMHCRTTGMWWLVALKLSWAVRCAAWTDDGSYMAQLASV